MTRLAFATSFAGLSLSKPCPGNASASIFGPRASMGDSVAPVIKIKDTKWDGTSSISVSMEKISASESDAVGVAGNGALGATLRRRAVSTPVMAPVSDKAPAGVAPKDFYFPSTTRNEAPIIDISPTSISVTYEAINPVVGGVSANSADSVAFWKETAFKYTAPDAPEVVEGAEVISTAAFEKYFPTKIRNRAPQIAIKPPVSGEDPTGGFVEVGNVLVGLNADLAREVSVKAGEEPAPAGSAVVAKYFPPDRNGMAPIIDIEPNTSVAFGMGSVAAPTDVAAEITAKFTSPDAVVDKTYPVGERYIAPEIKMDTAADSMSVSVSMSYVDEPSTEGIATGSAAQE